MDSINGDKVNSVSSRIAQAAEFNILQKHDLASMAKLNGLQLRQAVIAFNKQNYLEGNPKLLVRIKQGSSWEGNRQKALQAYGRVSLDVMRPGGEYREPIIRIQIKDGPFDVDEGSLKSSANKTRIYDLNPKQLKNTEILEFVEPDSIVVQSKLT